MVSRRQELKQEKRNKTIALTNMETKVGLLRRQTEINERNDFDKSTKGKMINSGSESLQARSNATNELIANYKTFIIKIKDEFFDFIKNVLKYDERNVEDIPFDEIEEVVVKSLKVFKKLKSISLDKNIEANKRAYTNYENLLIDLIKLDGRFVLFAPKKVIEKSDSSVKIKKLPDDLKRRMKLRCEKLKENEERDYVKEKHVVTTDNFSIDNDINAFLRNIYHKEHKIIFEYKKVLHKLAVDIYKNIKISLAENDNLTVQELEDYYVNDLSIITLRKECKNEKINYDNQLSAYEKLFVKLIELDRRFAVYAPVKAIKVQILI